MVFTEEDILVLERIDDDGMMDPVLGVRFPMPPGGIFSPLCLDADGGIVEHEAMLPPGWIADSDLMYRDWDGPAPNGYLNLPLAHLCGAVADIL